MLFFAQFKSNPASKTINKRNGENMSKLVRPHGGGELKPLLLTGDALKYELARAQSLPKVTHEFTRNRRPHHDGYRRLHTSRRLHDPCRLARRMRWLQNGQRSVLADSCHPVDRRREHQGRRRCRTGGRRNRRNHGHHEGDREIHHRQGPRVHAGLQDHRHGAPWRQDGDGSGQIQPGRPGQGSVHRRLQGRSTATSS